MTTATPLTFDFTQPVTRKEQFDAFNSANPHVLAELETLAEKLIHRGQSHIGIGYLFEILRYESFMRTEGDEYVLNNNFRSRYARLLIERHPEWARIISIRTLRST